MLRQRSFPSTSVGLMRSRQRRPPQLAAERNGHATVHVVTSTRTATRDLADAIGHPRDAEEAETDHLNLKEKRDPSSFHKPVRELKKSVA